MKQLKPKTKGQHDYLKAIQNNKITICLGPAGTGKTCLASRYGAQLFLEGLYEKLIVTRPLVQAGEDTGFLPGNITAKLDPYIRPIYDELMLYVCQNEFRNCLKERKIEICPFAYMRGRTFHGSYIIADELQNCTYEQLIMILTRFGQNSKMILNGDPDQSDLPKNKRGGLVLLAERLKNITDLSVIYLTNDDIVREPIVTEILEALNTL